MGYADDIAAAGEAARAAIDSRHRAREVTLAAARRIIQASAASIRATHRGEFGRAGELIAQGAAALAEADAALAAHPDLRVTGALPDAIKELVEANATLAFVSDAPLPTMEALGVSASAYLNGLAEAASELRRHALDCLREGRLDRAEQLVAIMDDVYALLVTIDYPDGVTGGLRRTTDALRGVLERTRGDLTTTMVAARLQASIERMESGER
ncbi:MAG: haloacid dehalogenase [Acidimicrobiia bacterium]